MTKAQAIALLRDQADPVRARGATALYLFGPTVRDAATASSDLDLFLDLDATSSFSLLDLVAIKRQLERRTGAVVDLTTRDALHPLLRNKIEASAVRVF